MSNLIPFDFKGHQVRLILDDSGEPWFIAVDLCVVLELGNITMVLKRLDDDEQTLISIEGIHTGPGNPNFNVINESGLYSLILGSRKLEAKQFKRWVTHEVLPSIRKTGGYSITQKFNIPQTLPEALRLAASLAEERDEAIRTKAEIGSRREATAMNTASSAVKALNKAQIDLDRSTEYATIKRVQALFNGLKFKYSLLKSVSREMDIPIIKVFDQNYGQINSYHLDVWREAYGLNIGELTGGVKCK